MSEEKKYYKGFDENFKCRGYQFEVGATYKHEGTVKACASGFHSCSNPWDVLNYYDITSRFAYVEVGGQTATHEGDTKIASAELIVKCELKLPNFITDCINYLKEVCKSDVDPSSGDYSQLAASGNYSQLAASGNSSKLAASGDYSQLAASGYSSIAMCAGTNGKVKGGLNCTLALARWVDSEKRYRITVAYVGENGIKPDIWYTLNERGEFVETEE